MSDTNAPSSTSAFTALLGGQAYQFRDGEQIWARPDFKSIAYSDGGATEKRIYDIIDKTEDLSCGSTQLSAQMSDWPSIYHLSPSRANLMRPIKHLLKGKVLEVGAGCGAITRYLGENGADVLALEGSAFRAQIAAKRCRGLNNVTVVADAFHELKPEPIFDAVTLIGVLEYSRMFFPAQSGDPVDAALAHVRRFLKPGGKLIVAIENQLGLKYFAGFAEDHKGIVGYGLEDQYVAREPVTFGRAELSRRIQASGLPHQKWLFPFPDYKVPSLLLTEAAADTNEGAVLMPAVGQIVASDPQTPAALYYAPENIWAPVMRNNLTGDLANSFLIAASAEAIPVSQDENGALGYAYSAGRRPAFAKQTTFANGKVIRRRLFPDAKLPDGLSISMNLEDEPLFHGQSWRQQLVSILNRRNWSLPQLETWFAVWLDAFLDLAQLKGKVLSIETPVSGALMDAIPRNMIVGADGKVNWIDKEWATSKSVELGFIIFRSVFTELACISSVAQPAPGTPIVHKYIFDHLTQKIGLTIPSSETLRYLTQEHEFQEQVIGFSTPFHAEELLLRQLNPRK